jgi:tetratricopeptide (TPR) repeat protein/transglutaminase-like putative cysteine protease
MKLIVFNIAFIAVLYVQPIMSFAQSSEGITSQAGLDFKAVTDSILVQIDKNYMQTETVTKQYKIMNEQARTDFGFFPISYDPVTEKIEILSAYTNNGGKIIPVPKKSFREERGLKKSAGGIVTLSKVIIPFSNLKIGTEIFVQYKLKQTKKLLALGAEFQMNYTNEYIGLNESLEILSQVPFKYFLSPEAESSKDYVKTYEERTNLKTKSAEYRLYLKGTPQNITQGRSDISVYSFHMSTFERWDQVNREISQKYMLELRKPLPDDLKKWVDVAKTKKDTTSQIDYLVSQVSANVAYAGDWTSLETRFNPKGYSEVLKVKNADCKDFSLVLAGMLRAMNYDAYVALTYRASPNTDTTRNELSFYSPGINIFNHAIVAVKFPGQSPLFIDPTNPLISSDYLRSDILASPALILDGKSNSLEILPDHNKFKQEIDVLRTYQYFPDNTALITGQMVMNKYSKVEFDIVQRQLGTETYKDVLQAFVALDKVKPESDIEMNENDNGQFSFKLHMDSPYNEKQNSHSSVSLKHVAAIVLSKLSRTQTGYLGEPSRISFKTVLPKHNVLDSTEASCYIVSRWLNVQRDVTNKPTGGMEIVDTLDVKRRYVAKNELKSDEYRDFVNSLANCVSKNELIISIHPKAMSEKGIALRSKMGPSIERATDKDIEALLDQDDVSLFEFKNLKAVLYYRKKINAGPPKADYYLQWALGIRNLGYQSGDKYNPDYLEESNNILKAGLKIYKDDLPLMMQQGINFTKEQNVSGATRLVNEMYKVNAHAFETALMAGIAATYKKEFSLAEKWLVKAKAMSNMSKRQKWLLRDTFSKMYKGQERWREARAIAQEEIDENPNNAWAYHNMAVLYDSEENWDMVIDFEKKALAITEFAMAKKIMSKALYRKADELFKNNYELKRNISSTSVKPSDLENIVELAGESMKQDVRNPDPYALFVRLYMFRYKITNDFENYQLAEVYLTKGQQIGGSEKFWTELKSWMQSSKAR